MSDTLDTADLCPATNPLDCQVDAVDALQERVDRAVALKKTYIVHDEVDRVFKSLELLRRYGNIGAEDGHAAKFVILSGESHSGKTSLLARWMKAYPVERTKYATRRPVIHVRVPKGAKPVHLAERVLMTAGEPAHLAMKGNLISKTARVLDLIKDVRNEVMVFDEFQHLVKSENDKVLDDVADWLKDLLNAACCSFVFAGTPRMNKVFRLNDELRNRMFSHHHLRPMDWNDETQRDTFRALINAYDSRTGLARSGNLADMPVAMRIHRFAGGHFGRAVNLLYRTAVLAYEEDAPCINWELLRQAVDDVRRAEPDGPWKKNKEWVNPFDVPAKHVLPEEPVAATEDEEEEDDSRRTRIRRGPRKPRAAEVFRT